MPIDAVLFGWIASISFGGSVIMGKLTSKYSIKNPWLFNFLWSSFLLIITSLIIILNHQLMLPKNWSFLILASVLSAISTILYTLGLFRLDVSVMSPLFNFRTAMTVLLGLFFLGEKLAYIQYFYIFIIFCAGLFVSWDEKMKLKSFFQWPILIIICCCLSLSVMSIFMNKSVAVNGFWPTSWWSMLISQIIFLLTAPLFIKEVKQLKPINIGLTIIIAIFETIGTLAAIKASASNVSISTAIISLPFSMIIAIILAALMPKLLEKHTRKVYLIRILAATVMFLAAIRLSI